ncbi:MAG TPA: ABC transporter permease [Candidatus Scatomonas merdigallinarum]|nr:ABC transporter permease [Candidatus Scatomonas merdigallinarum]
MTAYVENFKKYKPLLSELAVRDIKTRYRRSMLGVLWSLLSPLCQMIVLSIVFSNLFRNNIENFPLYILSGQVIFNFYSESTSSSLTAIIGSASLIKKAYIPKYLFVLSRILSSAVNVMATFAALIVVMLATRAEFHYTMFLAVIPILFVILFSSGVGLILAAYAVKFRDIIHLYGVFITALMYLTPIIYPMSMLPGVVHKIVMMNPLTNMVLMFRNLALDGIMPGPMSFVIALVECAAVILIGLYVFYKKQDTFILNL